MDFKTLEDDIVTMLRSKIAAYADGDIDIAPMPQNEEEYEKAINRPQIIVAFDEAHYLETESINATVQRENIRLVITLTAFSARDELGVFELRNMVQKFLFGYIPEGCHVPCTIKYFGPPKNDPAFIENFWIYEMHVDTRSVIVQDEYPDDELVTPSYTDTTINTTTEQQNFMPPLITLKEQ